VLPILFCGQMIRSIQDDLKSVTRRVVDFEKIAKQTGCRSGKLAWSKLLNNWAVFGGSQADLCEVNCPYGRVGDRLWVRETWSICAWGGSSDYVGIRYHADDATAAFPGTQDRMRKAFEKHCMEKRPSIFMPKFAARLFLDVTDIRVEPVQNISEADAKAEGVRKHDRSARVGATYRAEFAELWNSINSKRGFSWESNPYVWVISFTRRQPLAVSSEPLSG
jgi:hypothetical protein